MEDLLTAERAGSGEAKMILSELAAEEHLKEKPHLYKHPYDPHYSGLRGDDLTRVTRDFIDRKTNEQSYNMNKNNNTPSSSSQSLGVKSTPRSISPDRDKRERMKEELRDKINRENERIRYANSFLGRMRSRIGNFLKPKDDKQYLSIKEKRKEALRQNGPTARLAKLEEKSLTSKTEGGKKTHKNKKTSKRRKTSRK
jgi:hypothetical protein